MARQRRIPTQVAFGFSVPCGKGRHRVEFEVAAWGQIRVLNPCDVLSPAARKLAQSSCAKCLPEKLLAIEERLQSIWGSQPLTKTSLVLPAVAWKKLDDFTNFVRDHKESLAEQLLAAAPGQVSLDAESAEHARCWAALVLADRDPERAKALLAGSQGWPPAMLIAALCGHDWGDDPQVVLLVEQGLQDPRIMPGFRARFARVLGGIGQERHAALLVDAVCGPEAKIRTGALKGLDRLFERVRAQQPAGAAHVARALAVTLERAYEHFVQGEQHIVDWLTDWARPRWQLLREAVLVGGPPSRIFAAKLLEQLGDVRAAEALSQAACDREPEVSEAAASGLIALGPALVKAGEDSVPLLANALGGRCDRLTLFALDALRTIRSPRAVGSVLSVLQRAATRELKMAAMATLGTIGDERVIAPLLKDLGDGSEAVRSAAAQALTDVIERLAMQASSFALLRRTLASGHPQVAGVSLRRLTEPGFPDAVRVVADALPGLSEDLQVQALVALRELDHFKALDPVLELLMNPAAPLESHVREYAVLTASGLIGKLAGVSGTGLAVLVKALECPHLPIAREAAKALGACSDSRLAGPLLKACLRGDRELGQAAGKCLKNVASAGQLEGLALLLWHGDDCMARGAEAALVAVGKRAVEPLIKAVNWPYPRARLAAVRALGRIGDARALAVLQTASTDTNPQVRQLATAALNAVRSQPQ
jgi:HEAT repeat protein